MKTELLEKTSTPLFDAKEIAARFFWLNRNGCIRYHMKKRVELLETLRRNSREWQRKNGNRNEYRRKWYARVTDEAGCHMKLRDFHPAYRFIKELETAEIVEI